MNHQVSQHRNDTEHLAERIQQGDEKAFGLLYDKYAPLMMGVIMRIVDDKKMAEDILQTVFFIAWQEIKTSAISNDRFFTWLLNTTRNMAQAVRQEIKHPEIQLPGNLVGNEIIDLLYFKGYTLSKAAETLNIPTDELKARIKTEFRHIRRVTPQ